MNLPAHLLSAPPWAGALDDELADLATGAVTEPRFVINDRTEADWAMRRLGEVTADMNEIRRQAQEWRAQIDDWELRCTKCSASAAGLFSSLLSGFMHRCRAANERCKSIDLPSGRLTSTSVGAKIVITDQASYMAWAMHHDQRDALTKSTPSLTGLRGIAQLAHKALVDGEVVPGTDIEPARVRVTVSPTVTEGA